MKSIFSVFICLLYSFTALAQDNLERGKNYYNMQCYQEALPLLQTAAKEGFGEACYLLGQMYYNGKGTAQNHNIAFRMYQRGIEYGYNRGEAELGLMYEQGQGCAADTVKAFSLYREAHAKGDLIGSYRLAICYWNGEGVTRDRVEAFKILKMLYECKDFIQNYLWAYYWTCSLLGNCYEYGWGTNIDITTAVQFYNRSNKPQALYHAALLIDQHKLGHISGINEGKAGLIVSAINGGVEDAKAYFLLSLWLPKGGPIGGNDSNRFEYLLKAAEMGYGPAQKMCGDWYKTGKGTAVNLVKAREWYAKAKANGEEITE
ncbi:tetratricopeptide repeat protein [Coprobacter tertius]|uniref:Sel1 repeat family protein n=1 Tax=Coprobacter tertius TaxID=2944915 RepID=A0ABT1MJ39_9BACT|nr:tetratricopeptide repeat protein [Coprobacter tertius]MCP9612633.1 sel1 repeat family protein [Coprobacter tertius]